MHYYMICPKCYQQDHLLWRDLEECVLNEQLNKKPEVGPTPPHRMEGEYTCPYGCNAQMLLFALGTYEEVKKKSEELFEKYWDRIPENSLTKTL